MSLARQLTRLLGAEAVSVAPETLATHAGDKWFASHPPEAVVFAQSAEQVSRLLKFANRRAIPVTPRGSGYGYVGGCVPVRGGIALSLARMNRIKEINFADAVAVIEPGVITGVLAAEARKRKLFYPPDPASLNECSLGGNIATNAGGPRCLKYGVTRHYVLGLEAVLADGRVLRTGSRTHKNKTGFDLIGMFVGSEGLLGVVTEATLRLLPLPPARATLSASFRTFRQAATVVQEIFAAGFLPCALEIADAFTLEAAGEYLGKMLAPRGSAHLLIDLDGQPESVAAEARSLGALLTRLKAVNAKTAVGEAPRVLDVVESDRPYETERGHRGAARAARGPRGIRGKAAQKIRLPDRVLRPRGRRKHSREHHGRELPRGPRGREKGLRRA